jgi:hypothetical protein
MSSHVYVDGARHGYMYEVKRAEGLLLAPGQHVVDIRHESCQRLLLPVVIEPGQERVPPLVARCSPLPARLRIASNRDAPVRRKSDGQLLGQTNAEIEVPMTAIRQALRLTIGEPGVSLQTRDVSLAAGKTTTETVDF